MMQAIDEEIAAICITHVHYESGNILNMDAIIAHAHSVGAAAVWDLCHSAGAMPIDLNGCNVNFAVSCTYKYLNGGPDAPALLFAAERRHRRCLQPLTGWYSHAAPFDFDRDYRPAVGIRQMLSGTQPTASLSTAEIGIDIMLRADMNTIREKSMRMTDLFIELVEARCGDHDISLASPRNAEKRGSQVSFFHDEGYSIIRAMHDHDVGCDYREPGIMRFGFAPLYIRYVDVWDTAEKLREILESGIWKESKYSDRAAVT